MTSIFDIGRGHDGPARVGQIKTEMGALATPLLTGPSNLSSNYPSDTILQYGTLGRSVPRRGSQPATIQAASSSEIMLVAIPSFGQSGDTLDEITKQMILILPSPVSLEYSLPNHAEVVLQYQYEFLQNHASLDPEKCVLRVPSGTTRDGMARWMSSFKDIGVQAAAFTFDGKIGPSDWSLMELRSLVPSPVLTIALGRIPPSLLPFLYYLGFDVFDTGHAVEAAEQMIRLWPMTSEEIGRPSLQPTNMAANRYCPCLACTRLQLRGRGHEGPISIPSLLESHNLKVYQQVLSESLEALNSGRLRWLVETHAHSSPSHASILRKTTQGLYDYIEEFTPTTGPNELLLIGPQSYNAPAVKRFRDYVAARYAPPISKKIVLLLPCSARKPYSESKSHRRYLASVESAMGRHTGAIAQGILTSPLGLVPRELERAYPASVYDIPVTGDWDHEETEIAAEALGIYLAKFDKSAVVVAHVSGGYVDVVRAAESKIKQSLIYTTPDDSPSHRESLMALEETLADLKATISLDSSEYSPLMEIVRATLDYQFGAGAGEILLTSEVHVRGKPYGIILCKMGEIQVCSYIGNSGTVSLTLEGAKILKDLGSYWVRLEAPRAKGGSIFGVGVNQADPEIRPGDEVIVLNPADEVIAVGKSEMSGREMCELSRGRAVSIRHKLEAD